jgi:UDP-glucuronate 4-epimerase
MQILITGVAGFIGYNIANYLLHKSDVKIIGIDSLNTYYSKKLKKDRIKELSRYKRFSFFRTNILNKKKLEKIFKIKKINLVINLAAQAGVRYSLEKPSEFVDNNIHGFYTLIDTAKKYKIKKIIYASSSSIYGDSKKFPLNETQNVMPKNIYALSKKVNEEMAEVFSKQYDISFIGLRFFTVYGEWGRPDMFMMKYLTSSYNKKINFYLNNYGEHTRDFTYILDACKIISKLIFSKKKVNHEIFNVCSNNPKKLTDIIKKINFLTKKKPKLFKRKLQQADVVKTHGTNKKIKSFIGKQNFTSIDYGLKTTVEWFKNYYKI